MSKAKKLFVALVAALLAVSVCVFAFTSCSEDEPGEIVGISFSSESMTVKEGDRIDLKPNVTLSDGKDYTNRMGGLVWESDNEKVLSVAPGGILDAVSYGDAVVTCRSEENPSICASVDIRVNRDDTLRVGVKKDVYNFGYYTNYMEFEGMEIDLADRIAYELYFNDVEYVPLEAAEREDALNLGLSEREAEKAALEDEAAAGEGGSDESEDGKEESKREGVDCVIATYSVTPERAMQVYFSSTYYTDYVQVMVRRDFASKFSSYGNTLEGMFNYFTNDPDAPEDYTFTVGTANGTTAYQAFKEEASSIGNRFNDDGTTTTIQANFSSAQEEEDGYYDEYTNVANDLLDGKIDGFCGDHSILNGYMTSGTVFLDDAFSPQEYAVGTAIGSGLTDPINSLINDWLTIEDCVDSEGNPCTYIEWLMEKWGIETFEAEEEE